MKTLPPTTRTAPLVAIVAALVLLAAACGAPGAAESTAERALAGTDPSAASGVEYGATIDDWAENYKAPSVLEPRPVPDASTAHGQEPTIERPDSDSESIVWEDLIPAGSSGQEIVDRFASRLQTVEPGSEDARLLYEEIQAEYNPEAVNDELDGQQIRLAGFVAPLTYEDDIVTEFLLVPNFGACIHVPPPPPNQTIMVTVDKADGLTIEEAWGAVWVEGTIVIEASESELAPASYRIDSALSGVYNEI